MTQHLLKSLKTTFGNNLEIYKIYGNSAVASTIFDSIYTSFKSYFGDEFEIYFSVNNQNINLSNLGYEIDMNSAYTINEE